SYAVKVGTAWGWVMPRRVFVDLETVILAFAGPRRGKSAAAISSLLDWDGAAVATSIKDELVVTTIGARSERGDVFILNPEGIGEYATNFSFNPITGCQLPQTAARRAGTMIEAETGRGLSDGEFWRDQATMVLSGYLHAAALAGYSMSHVYAWCDGTDTTPLRILREAQGANSANRDDVANFLEHMPDRTKGSLVTTLRGALRFMQTPEVRAALDSQGPQFDVRDFLAGA